MADLILKPGKERAVKARHPWIFAQSVAKVMGRVENGGTVRVCAHDGTPLARAGISFTSGIRARIWRFDPDQPVDHAFFRRQVAQAVAWRARYPTLAGQSGVRLVHGEADGLPGVIVDRYGSVAVLQITFAGAERWRDVIVEALVRACPDLSAVYERSDSEVRQREGLAPRVGLLWGTLPETVSIDEYGVRFAVDIAGGHKTGFYLDQRENRRLVQQLASGLRVLNTFCYTGGFSLHALKGGAAEVWSVDSSASALTWLEKNLALNAALPTDRSRVLEADVFSGLREWLQAGELFDLVILDPPKFAPSAAHVPKAKRAYRDINLFGMRLVRPGGYLMTYSCSGGIGVEEFQALIATCAAENRRSGQIVARLSAGADHPIGLGAPEGEYLKGLLVRLD
ncbi:MAG TPA: class I SAM-dependent rRNA methyltransferase [Hydrogenophilus thermoluteolus]|nr:class I SAM-dependent rRNA methyltransferase [Hydrogenophilus thermoluteolus]